MTGGDNVRAQLEALAERAGRSYGAALESWIETAYTLHEARAIAGRGEWGPFLEHAGIPERTAQNMIRLAKAGLKPETISGLGGIRETLDVLAHSPGKVRELVNRHRRIDKLTADLGDARATLADLQERNALMEVAPENAKHFDALAEAQAERRTLRDEVNVEKVARMEAEAEVRGLAKRRKALEKRVRELEDVA